MGVLSHVAMMYGVIVNVQIIPRMRVSVGMMSDDSMCVYVSAVSVMVAVRFPRSA